MDQSESVEFVSKGTVVDEVLINSFQNTYKNVTCPTSFYTANITGQTNVIPSEFFFRDEIPNEEEMGAVTFRQKTTKWRNAKRQWMTDGINTIKDTINSYKNGYTDVYGIFKCLELTTKRMKPADTLQLVFFSDMKHSTKEYELEKLLINKTPGTFAIEEFKRLQKEQGIKQVNGKFNCVITIVTPQNFKNSNSIVTYWESFFKAWGLTTTINWR